MKENQCKGQGSCKGCSGGGCHSSKVDWHREAQLNALRIMELEAELAKAKSDVAREIFEEIENNYADFLYDGYRNIVVLTEKDFNELKKKFEGSENA